MQNQLARQADRMVRVRAMRRTGMIGSAKELVRVEEEVVEEVEDESEVEEGVGEDGEVGEVVVEYDFDEDCGCF